MSPKEIMDSPSKGTAILLAKAAEVEEAKGLKIQELLEERVILVARTEDRLNEIKDELKSLGYKAPRKKKENIAEVTVDNAEPVQ